MLAWKHNKNTAGGDMIDLCLLYPWPLSYFVLEDEPTFLHKSITFSKVHQLHGPASPTETCYLPVTLSVQPYTSHIHM